MSQLQNKVVFITGASSGIGAAAAQAFARKGSKLLLAARRMDRLEDMRESLRQAGAPAVHLLQLDVRDRAAVEHSFASLPDDWKKVDILINNAGLSRAMDKVQDGSPDDWDLMIDTNVKGLLYVTRAVVPGMVDRKSGHIINMGSIAGERAYAGGTVYCGSKAAERLLSDGMREDLLGTSIRLTSIDPGAVETEFSLVRFDGDSTRADKVYQGITPLTGDDIASIMVWVASQPQHINIGRILVTPTDQANSLNFSRRG
jgi:3-hydroxy acid dehydrogenase/malonic semialdehyde reductase